MIRWYADDMHIASDSKTPNSALSFIRRSRGYAPGPIALRDDGPEVLGVGADLKNTFTLTKGRFAIPSQHIGDMENYETVKFFEEVLSNLTSVYRVHPVAIAHDLHPGYLSTRWAKESGTRDRGQGAGNAELMLFPHPAPLCPYRVCYGRAWSDHQGHRRRV